jgi:hypothetical protein
VHQRIDSLPECAGVNPDARHDLLHKEPVQDSCHLKAAAANTLSHGPACRTHSVLIARIRTMVSGLTTPRVWSWLCPSPCRERRTD